MAERGPTQRKISNCGLLFVVGFVQRAWAAMRITVAHEAQSINRTAVTTT